MKRKTVRHFHEPGHAHELTFSSFRGKELLSGESACTHFALAIERANKAHHFDLLAFVFMPNHGHLLVLPREADPNIGAYIASIKRPTSSAMRECFERDDPGKFTSLLVQERPGKIVFRFWQEGPGYDRNLWTDEAIRASIEYIHANPVRRGLSQKASDWKWSSARWYEEASFDEAALGGLKVQRFGM